MTTRRKFLCALGLAGSLPAVARAGSPPRPGAPVERHALDAELEIRARRELEQRRLVVDYYRIGRKLAYPLALTSMVQPEVAVPGLARYPWSTWYMWTLEERLLCLGWAGEWLGDTAARSAAEAELTALAQWPDYGRPGASGLCCAHAGRVFFAALARWQWPGEERRGLLREACRRLVDGVLPKSDELFKTLGDRRDVLNRPAPHALLHNISLIATAGAALAAKAGGHPAAARLDRRLQALFGAVLELRGQGFTEAVAYDGYVLDFVADWLATLPRAERSALLDHPRFEQYLEQSYMLSAPGNAEQVAELGDVEPRQMPFHLSAQAKLLGLRPSGVRAWHMARCALDLLRVDALAALRMTGSLPERIVPRAGALDAHYAAVLRSGWDAADTAVAVSCATSPMGHLPPDSGTLVLGTRGSWLIADPGYQQYAKGDEREFTLGPAAHNAPVLNGLPVSQKRPRRLVLAEESRARHHLAVDLSECYPASLGLKAAVRHVWLVGRELVVVADRLESASPLAAGYHWHGHARAAWWVEPSAALLTLDGVRLWISSPSAELSAANLLRLPGSRGQLTLRSAVDPAGPVVWWIFALAGAPPEAALSADGRELRVAGQVLQAK